MVRGEMARVLVAATHGIWNCAQPQPDAVSQNAPGLGSSRVPPNALGLRGSRTPVPVRRGAAMSRACESRRTGWKERTMTKVIADITMSLDGFVTARNAGPDAGLGDDGMPLHAWVFGGHDVDEAVLAATTERSG